jgi:hypothetical protein
VVDKVTFETTKENQADSLPKLPIVKDNKMNKISNEKYMYVFILFTLNIINDNNVHHGLQLTMCIVKQV